MRAKSILGIIGSAAACCATIGNCEAAPQHPNILFILVDDLGIKDLGCYGSSFYESPNIDALAASGVRFLNAFSTCPVCSPSRASIMTGKYPTRLGITDWIPGMKNRGKKLLAPKIPHQLPLEEVTIAEALKKGGYATGFFGKWHLGGEGFYPNNQGFDVNVGGCEWGSPHKGYYSPWHIVTLKDGPKGEYLTDRIGDEAVKFLDQTAGKGKPFFLFLSFYAVHAPTQPCKRFLPKFTKKAAALPKLSTKKESEPEGRGKTKLRQDNPAYATQVAVMDENVGKVLKKINELGLTDNTFVVFTSDNGGLATLKRLAPTSNAPYRAGKGWCYDGGIRVPLIIKWPGVTKPGSKCSATVIGCDFYPTLLSVAGLPLMPKQHRDGVNLVPLLKGKTKKLDRDAIFWHYPHYHGSTWTPGGAMLKDGWKLVEFFEDGHVELYNTNNDIGEREELSKKYPEKVQEMLTELKKWQETTGAKMPTPNPDAGKNTSSKSKKGKKTKR